MDASSPPAAPSASTCEPASYAIRVGETALFNVTAVDYDNHPVQTRVHLQLVTHKYANGATQTIRGAATDVTTDANGHGQGAIRRADRRQHRGGGQRHHPEQRTWCSTPPICG